METDFVTWLTEQMMKRGWTNSELARRAEVSPSAISMVISGQREPGADLCLGIAQALGEPPVTIFRRAGILPSVGESDVHEEMMYWFDRLTDEDQERAIALLRSLAELREEQESKESTRERQERSKTKRRWSRGLDPSKA